MNKTVFLAFFVLVSWGSLLAQKPSGSKNPAKIAQEALAYEKAGDFYRAGVYYESAFALDAKKLDYAYHAGRCFLESRDYANAAKCLEKVKDKNKEYDKPGYKYAMSLKQTGQYDPARQAFENFINVYDGADKVQMKERVDTEIKGCNFALKAQEFTDPSIFIEHMDANAINTEKTEFAPIPFANDVLYFSSTISGVASIYRTQKNNGQWAPRQSPSLFLGKMEKPHFGNGSFTPDGKRFYFTQCDLVDGKPLCSIYVMMEADGKWTNPTKLPDYINVETTNTTHPFVTVEGGEEVLYFASNREGGKGGLDLWYCTRTVDSRGLNFSLPKNLGLNINTPGDEITPFYHTGSQTLYFSSSGRVSAGGLDIFKSAGSKLKWEVAQNMGFPINSDGDDLYYVISEAHGGGYFVSNRRFDPDKVVTTNDDIFHFVGQQEASVTIQGKVFAEEDASKKTMEDINLKVFEITASGEEELVFDKMYSIGEYKYTVKANKSYVFEISKPDSKYKTATFEVQTYDIKQTEVRNKDVVMVIPKNEPPAMTQKEMMNKIVPPNYDSYENPYPLPNEPPIDPTTGEPYAKGTPMYNVFQQINDIAERADGRKVYYDDAEKENIVEWTEKVAVVEPPKDNKEPDLRKEFPEDLYKEEAPEVRYKVQVAAVRNYKESRYKDLFNLKGMRLEFEPIADGLTRVLVVPEQADENNQLGFKSKAAALDALTYVINHTEFTKAFGARYENGERVGDGFRGLDEEQ